MHPWAPPRVLRWKYGIAKHDVDNWLRSNPNARQVIDRSTWRLTLDQSTTNIRAILERAWEYYVVEELQIDLDADDVVERLIRIKTPQKPFGFLVDGRYLQRLPGYSEWIEDGFTRVAFAICHIWPGRSFADNRNLLPALFLQTKRTAIGRQDAVGLVKHIYLNFLSDGLKSAEGVDHAKRRFYARYQESGFVTGAMLRASGMSALHLTGYGVAQLLDSVAREFASELGLEPDTASHWSSQSFRRSNPEMDYSQCRYCGRLPVDLHHLLPRSDFPDLANDAENVVPVCVHVHAAITRKTLGDSFVQAYGKAQNAWLNGDPGNRISQFDALMSLAHRETIGFATDTL